MNWYALKSFIFLLFFGEGFLAFYSFSIQDSRTRVISNLLNILKGLFSCLEAKIKHFHPLSRQLWPHCFSISHLFPYYSCHHHVTNTITEILRQIFVRIFLILNIQWENMQLLYSLEVCFVSFFLCVCCFFYQFAINFDLATLHYSQDKV